jgi:predicted DNA-binding transcriptional regulator YafY
MGKEPESRLQDKFFIDSSEWARTSAYESLFEIVRKGLWGNAELAISYHSELGSHAGTLTAVIQPLGLVAAAGSWYLVAGMAKHITVIPLARIRSAQITAEHFKSPPDFILESFWQDWMIRFRSQRPLFIVEANVADAVQPLLVKYLEFIDDSKPGDGWTRVTLHFDTFETARTLILGWGNAVEVLAPQALRLSIADYARQILTVYE